MRSQMREANRHHAKFAIIIGEDELAEASVTIRQMDNGEQFSVKSTEVVSWISEKLSAN